MDTRKTTIAMTSSYGRGVYAGHGTFGLDFTTPGSYGRGVYAGHSTFGLDFTTPGSYGRGVYAHRSTLEHDWTPSDDFARGMRNDAATPALLPELREHRAYTD